MKFFYRIPLRLTALILGAIVLVPVVLLASRLFPSEDRQTIALIVAFAMAASFVFPVLGPRKRKSE
jgi:glucose-6-phosphate-specific signal transduction histidine kinase